MQDFNYLFSNCFEITVELTCCKYPLGQDLNPEWNNNKRSLVQFLLKVHQGIKGYVKDVNGNVIQNARVFVEGSHKYVKTTQNGEFWRLLRPGNHSVAATSEDGSLFSGPQAVQVKDSGDATIVEIILDKHAQSVDDPANEKPHNVASNSLLSLFCYYFTIFSALCHLMLI